MTLHCFRLSVAADAKSLQLTPPHSRQQVTLTGHVATNQGLPACCGRHGDTIHLDNFVALAQHLRGGHTRDAGLDSAPIQRNAEGRLVRRLASEGLGSVDDQLFVSTGVRVREIRAACCRSKWSAAGRE